jgi:hypothetical protein
MAATSTLPPALDGGLATRRTLAILQDANLLGWREDGRRRV